MNRQSTQTRKRILRAAAECFSERGFRGTTIREICGKADANVAAVNYHFGSKDKLYFETNRFLFQDAGALLLSRTPLCITTAAEWEQELHNWCYSRLAQITSTEKHHLWRGRMFSRERSEPSSVLPMLLEEFLLPIRDRLMDLLRMALPEGVDDNTLQLWTVMTLSQCIVFAQRAGPWEPLLFPPHLPREKWLEATARHATESVTCRLTFRSGNLPATAKTTGTGT